MVNRTCKAQKHQVTSFGTGGCVWLEGCLCNNAWTSSLRLRRYSPEHNIAPPSITITHATSLSRPSFTAAPPQLYRSTESLTERNQTASATVQLYLLPPASATAVSRFDLVSSASLHHTHHQPQLYRDGRPHLSCRRRRLSRRARSGAALLRLAPVERGD
jgi:hypothetical protein